MTEQTPPRRKIAVLYTGGTIGMQAGDNGLKPSSDTVLEALARYQNDIDWHVQVCEPLIDSSQVKPEHWQTWQQWVWAQACDGMLILHGTDTMAYSAQVLAFALGELDTPVVITGAQHPLGTPAGDAEFNLDTAVQALLQHAAPKAVSMVFAGEIIAAVGSRKISTRSAHGFANKNHAPLALWQQGKWCVQAAAATLASATPSTRVPLQTDARIASHYCVPVSEQWALRLLLQSGLADVVIVQSFGHGNGLFSAADIAAMQAFQATGGVIINVSQVADGHVAAAYEASKALRDAGVLMAGSWTVETAYAKALVGLSAGLRGADLSTYLQQNVLGEWE
ncbi:asparaginase domain-containing protein [Vitreoscilla massiliensis]|uniref:Asparaginase domain-containing protein n=1 Tax=Vitreoscilla massiliensis TaxID=1689272 RepID=A0ABY4DZN9_9NEIS|nr:asparaginase domain-containing protein [Vitreoscilla massiliensis]UOO88543.1 asparaginase domain-containing protein [Vitreoscilla massiliensis]